MSKLYITFIPSKAFFTASSYFKSVNVLGNLTLPIIIALAYLKKKQGLDVEPKVLGRLNNETRFALNYFNVEYPEYLNDVKTQIKDIMDKTEGYIWKWQL